MNLRPTSADMEFRSARRGKQIKRRVLTELIIGANRKRGRSTAEYPSDGDGNQSDPAAPILRLTVRDFEVQPIEHRLAKPFIEHWHYSHNCPTGLNIFFGAFVNGELYAVADYGMGSNMDKGAALARRTGLPVRFQTVTQDWLDTPHKNMDVNGLTVGAYNCLELKRLCRQGEKGAAEIPLTRFISICHRTLKKRGIEFVVSYSEATWHPEKIDGKWQAVITEPTSGGIYRAANFQHLDQTVPEAHTVRESDGKIFHRRVAYKDMKRRNRGKPKEQWVSLAAVRQELGRVPILTPPKERWFIVL